MNIWNKKIKALRLSAKSFPQPEVLTVVESALARGEEHMNYKDFLEFDCSCKEQYIYQEAEHLIEKFNLSI
jgi:hypothetical protein